MEDSSKKEDVGAKKDEPRRLLKNEPGYLRRRLCGRAKQDARTWRGLCARLGDLRAKSRRR